jgi:hypothetical protein
VALIQVLLMAGIMGLLMLQIQLAARQQLSNAKAISERAEAMLLAQSSESALMFSLLTSPLEPLPSSENPFAAAWNFRGEPFRVGNATFMIQDESGLQPVPMFGSDDFVKALLSVGVESGRARALGEQLMELQGADSSGGRRAPLYPLQAQQQLLLLPGMDKELYERLRHIVTLYPTPGFNWLTAPAELQRLGLTESQVRGVEELRRSGDLNAMSRWRLTKKEEDERAVSSPGPGLRVTVNVENDGAFFSRTTTYIVRPYATDALGVWQREIGDRLASDERIK